MKKAQFSEGNSQVQSVVSTRAYDPLIYYSHVACVVFVWPMLIRPWAQQQTSATQTYAHT